MRVALKEWAVMIDALARGEQIITLRKGGLSEETGKFHIEHDRFLLFPTRYHQQRSSVVESAQARYDELVQTFPQEDVLWLEFYAELVEGRQLENLGAVRRLVGQHIWRDEVIEKRFDWGNDLGIHVMALRVYELPVCYELPMREEYSGCISWVELAEDIDVTVARPVLDDAPFAELLSRFTTAMELL